MGSRCFAVCGLCLMLLALAALAEERHVPEDYPTIQAAVDAAMNGDTISVRPGNYLENVLIDGRRGLVIRGEWPPDFSEDEICWDTVATHAVDVIISGTIVVRSSQRITMECLTVTGPGPGVQIEGRAGLPSTDIIIRYCNLLFNQGSAVELGDDYFRVVVSCSNVSSDPVHTETTEDVLRGTEILVTCSAFKNIEGPLATQAVPVTVAVIDSGIDRSIPSLSCYMWRNPGEIPGNGIDDDGNGYVDDINGWDYSDDDGDSLKGTPLHWHGTFVAGVLADTFEARAMPLGTRPALQIMDLRFLNSQAQFYSSDWQDLVRAIDYAVANGARVINMSIYASREPPAAVREAVKRAVDQEVLVVAIAGNDASQLGPIAAWQEVVTVGAVDVTGAAAGFSNTGAAVDLAALGVNVLSIIPGGEHGEESGTSFAAPLVAGIAAFQASIDPGLSSKDIETILRIGAIDVGSPGHDVETGWGVVD